MVDLSGKRVLIVGYTQLLNTFANAFREAGAEPNTLAPSPGDIEAGRVNNYLETTKAFEIAVIIAVQHWEHPFIETTSADWQLSLQFNFEQPVLIIQSIARHMIAHNIKGRIIVVSSAAGLKSFRNMSIPGTTLSALHAVARIAAVDLGAYGITINVVATGCIVQTDSFREVKGMDAIESHIPLRRLGWIDDDIMGVCRFLASDDAQYITGAIIPVDGGYSITKAGVSTVKKT